MNTDKDDYHLSFFRPTTPQAKANRDLALVLISIWAVAVFGFQILLRVVEKPVPEPVLVEFEQVLPSVSQGIASETDLKTYTLNCLTVLSKVFVAPKEKEVLQNAFSSAFFKQLTDEQKEDFSAKLSEFQVLQTEIKDIRDEKYIAERDRLNSAAAHLLGLSPSDVRSLMIAFSLKPEFTDPASAEDFEVIHAAMKKYTTHNQSFLTDWNFIGFPFHYFYTAVFLLVLFVFLCWLYCIRTDANHKKLSVNENM
ncbi:MAG: DUF4212 domain-containing protein [Bacteroidales bacterium]|nr:DUF4212 domain-containing protein [Bacteroidales bacterium]